MANITLVIPNNKITDIVESFAVNYGYQAKITNEAGEEIDNPETKAQFAKRQILDFIKENYKVYKSRQVETQRQQVIADAQAYTQDLSVS